MECPIQITENEVLHILRNVKDPEIDTVSIIDLGMVEAISIRQNSILIKVLPTFLGCPALDFIKSNIIRAVQDVTDCEVVEVEFLTSPPWTSDRITNEGKRGLKKFGISPPPSQLEADGSWHVDCPYCGSTYVTLENIFGPTACRSILYCKSCKNPFEAMKPVSILM
ncbi:1,2-phenylacetyl-CoA epoxidase subunit PaaD [Bacillus sp. JJ722]|uniref:1,2-phenylacetyl-CoA epoxidase subunit PaaD n=1 Tax=Bacillus sp. JJ722 TaxID=3122973 RepID=UPI003000B02B